jgi:predicted transcriptional regulator
MEVLLYDRELDLMEVLWERGSATAGEVRAALEDDLAYNTVLTILRRMEGKGYLRHEEEGRAHRYFPLVEQEQARGSALRRLLDGAFRSSPELLLTQLMKERALSESEIRRLNKVLQDHLPEEES